MCQISGLNVAVQRRLRLSPAVDDETLGKKKRAPPTPVGPVVVETVHEDAFRTREYEFLPNDDRVVLCDTELPGDLWTARKTRLFEVAVSLKVTVAMGTFSCADRVLTCFF
jgi:hypothetical protein